MNHDKEEQSLCDSNIGDEVVGFAENRMLEGRMKMMSCLLAALTEE